MSLTPSCFTKSQVDSAENARLGSSLTAHASTPNGFGTMGRHATFHATRQCSAIANRSDLSGNNTHEKTTHPRRRGSPILRASPRKNTLQNRTSSLRLLQTPRLHSRVRRWIRWQGVFQSLHLLRRSVVIRHWI